VTLIPEVITGRTEAPIPSIGASLGRPINPSNMARPPVVTPTAIPPTTVPTFFEKIASERRVAGRDFAEGIVLVVLGTGRIVAIEVVNGLQVVHERPEDAVGHGQIFGHVLLGQQLVDLVAVEIALR
jgi:hypothetical protein